MTTGDAEQLNGHVDRTDDWTKCDRIEMRTENGVVQSPGMVRGCIALVDNSADCEPRPAFSITHLPTGESISYPGCKYRGGYERAKRFADAIINVVPDTADRDVILECYNDVRVRFIGVSAEFQSPV